MKRSRHFPGGQSGLNSAANTNSNAGESDEEEEDYLTMDFSQFESKQGKSQLTYTQKRRKDAELSRQRGTVKSAKEREVEAREIGLKTSVLEHANKGFQMLEKLGFKKGMTLGKDDDGISTKLSEPIPINVSIGHKGVGVQQEQRELQEQLLQEMQSSEKTTVDKYRESATRKRDDRLDERDLIRVRKAIQQLDEMVGRSRSDFWMPEPKQRLLTDDYGTEDIKSRVREERGLYYSQAATDAEFVEGSEPAPDPFESAFEQLPVFDKLEVAINYIRDQYFYCVYCGDRYADAEEMRTLCPGKFREEHDGDD